MFEIKGIKNNTYYFEAFSNVGIYAPDGKNAILIDACDHPRMVKALDRQLSEMGLTVSAIIDTHCHVDHICGNRFFQDKYGCRIFSSKKEQGYIFYPAMEPEFYYAGINTDKSKNPFFLIEPSDSEVITEKNTPDGVEIISLPGHSFEMIGVKTADNVLFIADAILSKKTWDEYKLPFFYDVNAAIATLETLKTVKADIFVPAHNEPLEDICTLADYNTEKLKEKKELLFDICEGRAFDDIFEETMLRQELQIRTEKYPMYAVMVRNFLQALVNDERIYAVLENNRLVYHRK